MKRDFVFKTPTTTHDLMRQLTQWVKTLTDEEKRELREAMMKGIRPKKTNQGQWVN